MKKIILTLTIATVAYSPIVSSQNLLDKAKAKVSGKSNTKGEEGFKSLDEHAALWKDGKYGSKNRSGGMYEPGGKIEIKFNKGEDGKVSSITIGSKTYEVGSSASMPYVISYGYRGNLLYITPSTIVEYSLRNGKVWAEACYGQKMGIGKSEKEIVAFREQAEKIREEQEKEYFANAAEESKKAAAARKEKFGLAGKDVAKIEMINLKVPEKFGHFRGFTFDMQATLKDGSVISTANSSEGFMSDYEVTYSAENYKSRGIDGVILESGFVEDDKITVTVKCISNPSLTVSKDVVLKYNEDVSFNYRNGTTSNFGPGGNANNYRFEVKQVKHAQTGDKLLMIRIVNVSDGSSVVSEFKMGIDQTFHFSCNGGNGGESHSSWGVGNGGNGGNITVIKDPSVEYFNFNYSNNGGNSNGDYGTKRGRDGQYKEETRKVVFN